MCMEVGVRPEKGREEMKIKRQKAFKDMEGRVGDRREKERGLFPFLFSIFVPLL